MVLNHIDFYENFVSAQRLRTTYARHGKDDRSPSLDGGGFEVLHLKKDATQREASKTALPTPPRALRRTDDGSTPSRSAPALEIAAFIDGKAIRLGLDTLSGLNCVGKADLTPDQRKFVEPTSERFLQHAGCYYKAVGEIVLPVMVADETLVTTFTVVDTGHYPLGYVFGMEMLERYEFVINAASRKVTFCPDPFTTKEIKEFREEKEDSLMSKGLQAKTAIFTGNTKHRKGGNDDVSRVAYNIMKNELQKIVAEQAAELASLKSSNVKTKEPNRSVATETDQHNSQSLMLEFDELVKTLDVAVAKSEFHEPEFHEPEFHESEFHKSEFHEWNSMLNQTVKVPNIHTTSTKADSTRVRTTSTTSESSPTSYEFANVKYSSTSAKTKTEPSLDDKMNIMFKMVDNFEEEIVNSKRGLLKAVQNKGDSHEIEHKLPPSGRPLELIEHAPKFKCNVNNFEEVADFKNEFNMIIQTEEKPHTIENKFLPSGRPPEPHDDYELDHLRRLPQYEWDQAPPLPPPRHQTDYAHKEFAVDAPPTVKSCGGSVRMCTAAPPPVSVLWEHILATSR